MSEQPEPRPSENCDACRKIWLLFARVLQLQRNEVSGHYIWPNQSERKA